MKCKRWSRVGLILAVAGCSAGQVETQESISGATAERDGGGHDSGYLNGDDSTHGSATDGPNGESAASGEEGTFDGVDDTCKEHVIRNEPVTPDMLIVLDRSGSMRGGTNRWDPSVKGIKAITSQLDTAINFGLMLFPAKAGACNTGTVEVGVGPSKSAEIANVLGMATPTGSTPTAASLAAAHSELGSATVAPDQVPRPKLVLLVTDGAPNCMDISQICKITGYSQAEIKAYTECTSTAIVNATVDEITKMAADGIKTYVIGYDTQKDAKLASAMDKMAAAGGTGDTKHRPVEDTASLVSAFSEIAGKAVSCTFLLEEAPKDIGYVQVNVDGSQINLNEPDGWTLGPDGKTIQVQGAPCALLQSGGQHMLDVQIKCGVVPII